MPALHPLLYDTLLFALEMAGIALLAVVGGAVNIALVSLIHWLLNR